MTTINLDQLPIRALVYIVFDIVDRLGVDVTDWPAYAINLYNTVSQELGNRQDFSVGELFESYGLVPSGQTLYQHKLAQRLVQQHGEKWINAIKEYRQATGKGLRESKLAIEQAMKDLGIQKPNR